MNIFAPLPNAIDYVLNLDFESFLRVFWFFIIFDFPRYFLTDVWVLLRDKFSKEDPSHSQAFELRLQKEPPLVSVIIPALNEQHTISWTIRSLVEQNYGNLEIIVVDDGSTDDTPNICRKLARTENISYYRFSARAGKSAVLNYGLKFARGEFIVFVDSDTTFDRNAILRLVSRFADPTVGGVAGNLRVRNYRRNLLTTLQQLEYLFTISVGRRIRAEFGILPIISGAFGGFRRDLISAETMGGHEPGPGNDSDLAIRIRKKGYRILFAADAFCLTNTPETLWGLLKQRARWDRNIIRNRLRKHRNVFNPNSANFRLRDVVTFADSLFFHVGMSFVTVVYLVDMTFNYPRYLPILLLINFCLYFSVEVVELIIAVLLNRKRQDLALMIYLPLFNPYKLFLKLVRVFAYSQELFFRYSLRDTFAPYKVRQSMIRW